jgi:lysophospholipase L1-like esterase
MKVLFLGDSITEGVPGVSFITMMQDNSSSYDLVNRGVGGDTVSSLLKRVKKMNDLSSFDQIILFIGVNDVFGKLTNTYKILKTLTKQRWAKDSLVFKNQYTDLITLIIKENKNIIIVPPLLIGEDINNKWNIELQSLRNIIIDISKHNNLEYLDVYSKFIQYLKDKHISDYLPMKITELYKDVQGLTNSVLVDQKSDTRGLHLTLDGVHINSSGATLISNTISEYINSLSTQ